MTVDLDALRALAEQATPGPWVSGTIGGRCHKEHRHTGPPPRGDCEYVYALSDDGSNVFQVPTGELGPSSQDALMVAGQYDYEEGGILRREDAAFIAAANPQTVLALIEAVEAAQAPA